MTANTLHGQTARLIASIATCLPPLSAKEMQGWIDNPRGLKKFLSGMQSSRGSVEFLPTFTVWKTVTLGNYKDLNTLREVLQSVNCGVSEHANDLLSNPALTLATEQTEVDLVVLSVKELGLEDHVTYSRICKKAILLGLELCPAEVGPALRLVYDDQARGEWIRIAMESILDSEGDCIIFNVGRGHEELHLNGSYGGPSTVWHHKDHFVFVLPRK